MLRFVNQYGRFFAALVRPLVWLFIFAAGFRSVLGVSIIPPYQTYVLYEVYITPGLIGMIHAVQWHADLALDGLRSRDGQYAHADGDPMPRWYLLTCKLLAAVLVSILQVFVYLVIASLFFRIRPPAYGYVAMIPALILAGLMLGSIGLLLSSVIRQLENFAGIMNFVIFPMFFASSALYPLWRMKESSLTLYYICAWNPFSHAVELVRFALYGQVNWQALGVTLAYLFVFLAAAIYGYDPSRGIIARRGGPPG